MSAELIYPGAHYVPIRSSGAGPAGRMSRRRGTSWHIAVTRQERSIRGWVAQAEACQFFNGRHGYMEQYMLADQVAYGVSDGNSEVGTVESWDGLDVQTERTVDGLGPNNSQWDAGQLERGADLMAWQAVHLGIPIRLMANTRDTGHGPHRLGILPWRGPNDQKWSSHKGKSCPGDMRIAQLPSMVLRAIEIHRLYVAGKLTWLPPGVVDVPAALARGKSGGGTLPPANSDDSKDWSEMATKEEIKAAFREVLAEPVKSRAGTGLLAHDSKGKEIRDTKGSYADAIEGTYASVVRAK